MLGGDKKYMITSRELIKGLERIPCSFIIARDPNNTEYVIESYRRICTEANTDDSSKLLELAIRKVNTCNLKK